jgi:hypothetical protein
MQGWILTHLHQARVFVDHCVPDAAPLLPPKLAQQALSNHVTLSLDPTVSQLQRDVGHMLGELINGPKVRLARDRYCRLYCIMYR